MWILIIRHKFAQSKGLKDRIIFLGWINTEQKETLFSNTIMCVLPSYFEGLSMTVIESMAHGIPILTTNISTMTRGLLEKIIK